MKASLVTNPVFSISIFSNITVVKKDTGSLHSSLSTIRNS
uniref:Calcium-binding EF hand family protein n=1 Tax=Arundo donax TaxID=35708 RepID=A0A0A9CCN6_ARUDO